MATSADLYAALGVDPSAPHAAVRQAYRAIMRATHPDVAGDDPRATDRAIAANAAWAVLRDPAARARYDRQRLDRAPGAGDARPTSGGPGGVRPTTFTQLREVAARESAYSRLRSDQRDAFSAASLRLGITVVLVGLVLLALVTLR